ncbi:hypothetical protein EVAR_76187_1 [Eumeta japonica]|uniref:Uncharacterized protein n=1 Tax=Eumeta variegata TaxID=151549 RepID=A0A4C1UXD1_EUMVA|nr:hypothetical protein EVAR_76187_1 [Eumeta japonica]
MKESIDFSIREIEKPSGILRRLRAIHNFYEILGNICTALCKGDSGGGLVFAKTEEQLQRYYLKGVASTAPQ